MCRSLFLVAPVLTSFLLGPGSASAQHAAQAPAPQQAPGSYSLEAPPNTGGVYQFDPAATPFDHGASHDGGHGAVPEHGGHAAEHGTPHDPLAADPHEAHGGHNAHSSHGAGHDAHGSHGGHGAHGSHGGHHHYHDPESHHEDEYGRLYITPYFRDFTSDVWDDTFEAMIGFNLGTTFWTEWEHGYVGDYRRVGLITEFNYGYMEGEDNTQLNASNVTLFSRETLFQRVDHAELYAGSVGLAFEETWELAGHGERIDFGFAPVLTIGNLNSDLDSVAGAPNDNQIFLERFTSDNGTLVNLDLRVWTGMTFSNDVKLGVTGFYGFGETDSVFGRSEKMNSFGAGAYLDIPTDWVPKHPPLPTGTLQWVEYVFGLE